MWFTAVTDRFFKPGSKKKKKVQTSHFFFLVVWGGFFCFVFWGFFVGFWVGLVCCFVCVNATPEMLSISNISIPLNHYHKPPWYSGEIALGSDFQCLTRYSALHTFPGGVGMYVLYVHLESFTHFWYIPTASAVKIQILWCQWNYIFFLKKVVVFMCT